MEAPVSICQDRSITCDLGSSVSSSTEEPNILQTMNTSWLLRLGVHGYLPQAVVALSAAGARQQRVGMPAGGQSGVRG